MGVGYRVIQDITI